MYTYDNAALPYDAYVGEPKTFRPRKHPTITEEMHDRIKRLYQNKTDSSGEVSAFAEKHGIPRWKITNYAQRMGWIKKQKKEPNWTEAELKILKRNAHKLPGSIQRRLARSGYHRSVTGITVKRKRMRFLQNLEGQSASQLALCFGESPKWVTRQIEQGLLQAERRGTNRTLEQGGDIWYIKDQDVRRFIMENVGGIDFRKIDKFWLVDILTGRGATNGNE